MKLLLFFCITMIFGCNRSEVSSSCEERASKVKKSPEVVAQAVLAAEGLCKRKGWNHPDCSEMKESISDLLEKAGSVFLDVVKECPDQLPPSEAKQVAEYLGALKSSSKKLGL